jgi:prophage DNA circulation protein
MSWFDELRPAKFRGVEFYVHASDMKAGRTTVTHSVPGSNKRPFKEDLGSEGRSHSVEAYVFGDEYQLALRRLIDAIDQGTPAELNHPFIGVALCIVEGEFSVRQSGDEGGFAVVSVTFSETSPAMPAPTAIATDATSALKAIVQQTKASAAAAFAAQVQALLADGITGLSFFAGAELLDQVGEQLEAALAAVAVPGELLAEFQRQLAAPLVRADAFAANAAGYFPALIDSLFGGVAASLIDAASLVAQPVTVLLSLIDAVQVPDDADEETQAIAPALTLLVQRGALCAAAEVLPLQQFDAYETAVAGRQAVIDAINKHSAAAADDTYADFVDLRGAVARAVPSADSNLPRLQQYTPPAGVPSLVLAHRLYGDVDAEADIVARNRIPNPALIPGGRPLEVLSRG